MLEHQFERIKRLADNLQAIDEFAQSNGVKAVVLVVVGSGMTLTVGRYEEDVSMEMDLPIGKMATLRPDEWITPLLKKSWKEFDEYILSAERTAEKQARELLEKVSAH